RAARATRHEVPARILSSKGMDMFGNFSKPQPHRAGTDVPGWDREPSEEGCDVSHCNSRIKSGERGRVVLAVTHESVPIPDSGRVLSEQSREQRDRSGSLVGDADSQVNVNA